MDDAERSNEISLLNPSQLTKHLEKHEKTFSCPCCSSVGKWSVQVHAMGPNLGPDVERPDFAREVMVPRGIKSMEIKDFPRFQDIQAIPVTCQVCGYISFFDANIVLGEQNERDS